MTLENSLSDEDSIASSDPRTGPRASGLGWHYRDRYLINEFLGRVGHTPAWIVEVEGHQFSLPPEPGFLGRLFSRRRPPRVILRNSRRLAFVWSITWPPPDERGKKQMVDLALSRAKKLGRSTTPGCGVCGDLWEGGPTMVKSRARHLCPECSDQIEAEKEATPPGPLGTWMWCVAAGLSGFLIQLLFHQQFSWSATPLAMLAGWLMATANGPNFDRQPLRTPLLTLLLLALLQITAWTFITGARLGHTDPAHLGSIFVWTVLALPPALIFGIFAGAGGMVMARLEKRLERV